MELSEYNILWIDDEHETLSGTKGRAKRNGINLIPFKSLNQGMDELIKKIDFFDGILLDAKFFENEDDSPGTEDTLNVHKAHKQLLELSSRKKFEIFVLTGQAQAFNDHTFNEVFDNVYEKGNDEHIEKLFKDIKIAADCINETQIRFQYKPVFDVCSDKYLGLRTARSLIQLLKAGDSIDLNEYFNTIRKIIEDIFHSFNRNGLLPDDFVKPVVQLNPSNLFLAGKDQHEKAHSKLKKYKHLPETHLPSQIAHNLRSILYISQNGSHRDEIDEYVRNLNTPYMFKSTLYQLMDIIVWFKLYVDSNPKTNNWVIDEKLL